MSNGIKPLDRLFGAVDRERDAGAPEQDLRFGRLLPERIHVLNAEPLGERTIGRADSAPEAVHFIESRDQDHPPVTSAFFSYRRKSYRKGQANLRKAWKCCT